MALWAAIVGALHSSFLAFSLNFSDTIEYNKAYYSAVSSLERAELVLRYRSPWFQGSGGWIGSETFGFTGDSQLTGFSYVSKDNQNGLRWEIKSRASQIPGTWQGNVDRMLVTGDSLNYNMLDYTTAENFIFEVDDLKVSARNPYLSWDILAPSTVTSFSGQIRLPLSLTDSFGVLGGADDAMVDWSLKGEYVEFQKSQFMIFPTVKKNKNSGEVYYNEDSVIRGRRINEESPLDFSTNFSPFKYSNISLHNMISYLEDILSGKNFSSLLSDDKLTDPRFRIALLNLLTSANGLIYPYLEYQFGFYDKDKKLTDIADKYYTISARWKQGNYEVELLVKKPTFKESILGSFTVIF